MIHNTITPDIRESSLWNDIAFAVENQITVRIPMGAMGFTYDREFLFEHGILVPCENHDVTDDNIEGASLMDCLMKMYRLCVLYNENDRMLCIEGFMTEIMKCIRHNLPLDSAC
jgi:hypothetical protein